MFNAPPFSEKEWQIILELLREEETELGPEIHHSEHGKFRDDLHVRKNSIKEMVQRLESALASPTAR